MDLVKNEMLSRVLESQYSVCWEMSLARMS